MKRGVLTGAAGGPEETRRRQAQAGKTGEGERQPHAHNSFYCSANMFILAWPHCTPSSTWVSSIVATRESVGCILCEHATRACASRSGHNCRLYLMHALHVLCRLQSLSLGPLIAPAPVPTFSNSQLHGTPEFGGASASV